MKKGSKEKLLKSTGSMVITVVRDLNVMEDFYTYSLENVKDAGNHIIDRRVVKGMTDKKWGEVIRFLGKLQEANTRGGVVGLAEEFEKSAPNVDSAMNQSMMYMIEVVRAPMRYETLLFEMIVVHAVAVLESFIKNYLSLVYAANPSMLKSSKEMTFEQLAAVKSKRHLLELMTAKELRFVSALSMKKLSKYLKEKFGFDLSTEFWGVRALGDIIQHRNYIVHQREPGLSDVPSSNTLDSIVGNREDRERFVRATVTIIQAFANHLHSTISKKLKLV